MNDEELAGYTRAERYHSLDALRGSMMLLGLVLHTAASYTQNPLGAAWPYQDAHTSVVFDLLVFFIHLYRMPVFFVVAGFFGALLYHRDGAVGFVRNRTKRVLLPLVLAMATVIPVLAFSFAFLLRMPGGSVELTRELDELPVLRMPILGHLWFLYDLLLFYAAAAILVPLSTHLPVHVRDRVKSVLRSTATNLRGVLLLAVVTTITLVPMKVPGLETSAALLPPIRVLVAYAVFFAYGWLLFGCRDLLGSFGRGWGGWFAAGTCGAAVYLAWVIARPMADRMLWHIVSVALAGASTWLLIFGIVGLFVRHLTSPRPLVRYYSDASYWIYLVHLLPILWGVTLLARASAPALLKFAIVLIGATLVTAVTYHYFVRSTAIGALLNGRRYPRSLPQIAPAPTNASV